jgi:localization factor PodJL
MAASIDDAIAEIAARQHALDSNSAGVEPVIAPQQPKPAPQARSAPQTQPAPQVQAPPPPRQVPPVFTPPPPVFAPAPPAFTPPPPVFSPPPPEPVLDLKNLDSQLRDITARIEALRPSSELEASIKGIRADLSEIANLITTALPQRAVDSLEIEVKALGERIEHSRQSGVDTGALAGLERGLNEIHDALRVLTPAEGLVGFEDAVHGLSQKLDMLAAKEDPAALQQLETAIGALRGIVSHVASNETLTKVAEDVRALSAKVDTLASTAVSTESLSAIEHRIDTLTNALAASADAGQAVPRELEKLLSGLIEKLEWVQLTHTDHAALAHLEDRIATLVQRFDSSDARLIHLEAVERGIADLLVHIDEIRGLAQRGVMSPSTAPSGGIERDVARAQDSLEAVQGTVEQVVDRLAMIESGIRQNTPQTITPTPQPVPAKPSPTPAQSAPFSSASTPNPSTPSSFSAAAMRASAAPAPTPPAEISTGSAIEITVPRATAGRDPIDPNLPPDHPLEPGSGSGRPRSASAADRIAASEAAAGSVKPPVIADSGEKPNFIAAARRAAQAAAAAPATKAEAKAEAKAAKAEAKAALKAKAAVDPNQPVPMPRTRKLIVAGAAALILLGGIQIATKFFDGSAPNPPPSSPTDTQQGKAAPPAAVLPQAEQAAPPPAAPVPSPTPVPAEPPAAAPSPLPNPKSSEAKPAPQAEIQPSAPMALTPNADVTGSLPHAAPATLAPTGDKLPATIGGPTLRAAALSGDGAASYEVGMRFAEGHGVPANNAEAALWFERAAKQGLVPAQFRLGGLYEKGLGVKKNLVTARDLYLAAANKGNGKAMHNLAVLYAEGIEGSPDYSNASHWFREAADRGVTDSQYNLGILYARGIGVAQNFAESYKWFALAANQGDEDAGKKRDEVAAKLDQQSLTAARLAVDTWKAALQPDEAINVKSPPGGWDVTQTNAVKPKPRPVAAAKGTEAVAKTN